MEKNYIGGFIKAIETQYGEILDCTLKVDDLTSLPKDEYGCVKITIMRRKEPDKFGNTHYAVENTYKKQNKPEQKVSEQSGLEEDDALPF